MSKQNSSSGNTHTIDAVPAINFASKDNSGSNKKQATGVKILLVEDDEDFSAALVSRLTKRNFEVIKSASAEEALELFKTSDFDAVVADIKLPGMDGMEFLTRVRDRNKDFPVILMTGYASLETAAAAVKLNAADYLLKPLENIEELLNPIHKAVHGYRLYIENKKLTDALREKLKELERSERRYRDLFELASDIIYIVDTEGTITDANRRLGEVMKCERKELIGKSASGIITSIEEGMDKIIFQKALAEKTYNMLEVKMVTTDGEMRLGEMGIRPIEEEGDVIGVQCIVRDITDRKKNEERLRESEAKLTEQKLSLEQKNSALKEILEQIEIEKKRIKDDIFMNIDKLLVPFLKKLRRRSASVDAKYINTIEQQLGDLVAPFGRKITDKRMKLTAREVEIANMVKNGFSSKEISEFLNISSPTTERHRNNIRRKMGLVNKEVNLRTFLQAL